MWSNAAPTSRDLRQQEDLAAGTDRLQQRVLVDLAVDGHGDAVLEMALEGRMQLAELPEEVPHGRRRKLELRHAPRELREVPHQHDTGHARSDLVEGALLEGL